MKSNSDTWSPAFSNHL